MKWLKKAGYVLCLLVFLLLTLGPFVWAFILSITPEHAMLAKSTALLPEVVTWKNYLELFGGSRKGQLLFAGIANSLKAVGHDFVGWGFHLSDECIHVESYGI